MTEQQIKEIMALVRQYTTAMVKGAVYLIRGLDAQQHVAEANASISAIESALRAVPAIPEGWKLVPIRPTLEMANAGADVDPERQSVWDAMLSASPQAPQPTQPDSWAEYLKEGETPFERFMRERADLSALLGLYEKALAKVEQPNTEPQP
jgi:hypothetical protein